VLNVIYAARSKYLRAGEPMFLSQPFKGGEKWDTDPTAGMIIDNRLFPPPKKVTPSGTLVETPSQKLPYAYFFEGLVRQCLLNYLKANSSSLGGSMRQQVFAFGSNMCSGRFATMECPPKAQGAPPCSLAIVFCSTREAQTTSPEKLTSLRIWAQTFGACCTPSRMLT